MSLQTHHITSHSTGLPSHTRVPAQNYSDFEPIYVMLCVFLFQMALLFWYAHLHDLLKVWNSQWSRCTVSLDSQTGWWWAFDKVCGDTRCLKGTSFMIIWLISNLLHSCVFYFFPSHSSVMYFLPWVTLQLLLESFDVAVLSRLSGDMARSCREMSICNLQGHTPCWWWLLLLLSKVV